MKRRWGCHLLESLVSRIRRNRSGDLETAEDGQAGAQAALDDDAGASAAEHTQQPAAASGDQLSGRQKRKVKLLSGKNKKSKQKVATDATSPAVVVHEPETLVLDVAPTTLLSADVGRAKMNVRQRNRRAPTAAHLRKLAAAADDSDHGDDDAGLHRVDETLAAGELTQNQTPMVVHVTVEDHRPPSLTEDSAASRPSSPHIGAEEGEENNADVSRDADTGVVVIPSDAGSLRTDTATDEPTTASTDASAAEPVAPVDVATEPVTHGAHTAGSGEPHEVDRSDHTSVDKTESPIGDNIAEAESIDRKAGEEISAVEADSVAVNIADSGVDTEHELDDSTHEDSSTPGLPSAETEENGAENEEVKKSTETQSEVHGSRIDWDALGKPKDRSSAAENAEFSQVFNKVVKQQSAKESKVSSADASPSKPCSRSKTSLPMRTSQDSETTKPSEKTKPSKKTKPVDLPHKPLEPSSSKTDRPVAVKTADKETEELKTAKDTATASGSTKPSYPSKESSTASEAKPHSEDKKPSSPGKDHVESKSKAHGKAAATLSDSSRPSRPGKESSPASQGKPHSEDKKPSSAGEGHVETKSKEHDKDMKNTDSDKTAATSSDSMRPSRPGKESLPASHVKPHIEGKKPSSSGKDGVENMSKSHDKDRKLSAPSKESSLVSQLHSQNEERKLTSAGQESPASKNDPRSKRRKPASPGKESVHASTEQPTEGKPAEHRHKLTHTPQSDSKQENVAKDPGIDQDKGVSQASKQVDRDSNSNVVSSQASNASKEPSAASCVARDNTKNSSSLAGQAEGVNKNETGPSSAAADKTDLKSPTSTESGGAAKENVIVIDKISKGRTPPSVEHASKSADTAKPRPQAGSTKDQTVEDGEPGSRSSLTEPYVAKPVPAQQKKVVQKRSTAKVQPSDSKSEEPAWVLAARRKSNQWNETRAEEFDRKPERSSSVDAETEESDLHRFGTRGSVREMVKKMQTN